MEEEVKIQEMKIEMKKKGFEFSRDGIVKSLKLNYKCANSANNEKAKRSYVRLTLDRLPGMRADLVRLDDNWQEWDFCQLVDSLRRWTERNAKTAGNPEKNFRRENLFQVRDKDQKPAYVSVCCEKPGYKSSECELLSETHERRLILSKKKLCFNCTVSKHRATVPILSNSQNCFSWLSRAFD